jgi:hypothetical protein
MRLPDFTIAAKDLFRGCGRKRAKGKESRTDHEEKGINGRRSGEKCGVNGANAGNCADSRRTVWQDCHTSDLEMTSNLNEHLLKPGEEI